MEHTIWIWIGFNLFVLSMLALDLGVFHRKTHAISVPEAIGWSVFWITLALVFCAGLWAFEGPTPALEFLTGFLIEKSLSVDNLFVFLLIFTYFNVPRLYQHKVLFWGIIGALVFRGIFIITGVKLIHQFHWLIYVFGVFLVLSGIKMALQKDKKVEPEKNPVIRLSQRCFKVTHSFESGTFFVREGGKLVATPLFVTLLFVEMTDIVFAVDSIPAILAVSRDPFIVYTANVFAILGLRSLYFALAGIMGMFHYLHYGLSLILVFVGFKMMLSDTAYKILTANALGIVALILLLSVVLSMVLPQKKTELEEELEEAITKNAEMDAALEEKISSENH